MTPENVKEPTQQIFDAIYKASDGLGYRTYDFKPMNEVGYPFVELGNAQIVPLPTKTTILGRVVIQVNIWGLGTRRREVSDMTNRLYTAIRKIKHTDSLLWSVDVEASNIEIRQDTTTNTPLYRGILDLEIKFY